MLKGNYKSSLKNKFIELKLFLGRLETRLKLLQNRLLPPKTLQSTIKFYRFQFKI